MVLYSIKDYWAEIIALILALINLIVRDYDLMFVYIGIALTIFLLTKVLIFDKIQV